MDFDALAAFAAAMFTILNPIGNTALFAGMVSGMSAGERRAIIRKSTFAIAVILIVTLWIGEQVLAFFGVSIPSLEAAGGLVIGVIGMSMLHGKQSAVHADSSEDTNSGAADSIAVVPLAMPIVAGPGAIATVIVNTHLYQGFDSNIKMSIVCLAVSAMVGLCFLAVGPIVRILGASGLSIVTKFMGLILLAIAVGMFASGVQGLFPGLGV